MPWFGEKYTYFPNSQCFKVTFVEHPKLLILSWWMWGWMVS